MDDAPLRGRVRVRQPAHQRASIPEYEAATAEIAVSVEPADDRSPADD